MRNKYMIYSIHHKNEDFPAYKNEVVSPIMADPGPEKCRAGILLYKDTDIAAGEPVYFNSAIFQQYKSSHPLYANEIFADIELYPEKKFGTEMKEVFRRYFIRKKLKKKQERTDCLHFLASVCSLFIFVGI